MNANSKKRWSIRGLRAILYPLSAILVFLLLWSFFAHRIQTSLGSIPGPMQVYRAAGYLFQESFDGRTGQPTYIRQIGTSLGTVFTGFLIASLIAVPLGLLCGLNKGVYMALNPLIQVFKPISPLAWLPIVTIVISSVYASNDGLFQKSFIISAITVSLCSIWPTLINTALGVDSINKDYLNLARVFRLNTRKKIVKIVLPSTLPFIFTGLRISLGIGWMVLIATEMLAQNPGLGKFIWDEFQNGSSSSLAKIFVAVITIGIIGFLLDRLMFLLERLVSYKTT